MNLNVVNNCTHIDVKMADFDEEDWNDEIENFDHHHQRIDEAPDADELLGPWTVVALMLNRTVGIVFPHERGTHSSLNEQALEFSCLPSRFLTEQAVSLAHCFFGHLAVYSALLDCWFGSNSGFQSRFTT